MSIRYFLIKFCCIILVCGVSGCSSPPPTEQSIKQIDNRHLAIITPDWNIAGVLTAIGQPPVATGDIRAYPAWSLKPALPDTVVDLGARFQPNAEIMAQIQYDKVIDNDFYQHLRQQYGDKPVLSFASGSEIGAIHRWQDYVEETQKIASFVDRLPEANQYIEESEQTLIKFGEQFRQKHPTIKKIAVVQFANANHIRNYTANSLFKPALDNMGLQMYEHGKGNMWGNVDMTLLDLATIGDDVCLVVIEPYSPMLQSELANNALWQRMGYHHGNRCLMVLPPVWLFGGVPSILSFAEFLANATPVKPVENQQK